MHPSTRLNKFLAHATGLSRREADERINQGRVTVNGQRVSMGKQVTPDDIVVLDGKKVAQATHYTYLAIHKPVGYLCSRRSQGGVPTIFELLPSEYRSLKPVGRLDKDSSGILLLTDDGDYAFQMTHPRFHKIKIYEVQLDRPLEPLHQQMISDHGITLDDGVSQLLIEKITEEKQPTYRITMSEGRNRQIRRTFDALGYIVTKLHRTQFGAYILDDLPVGQSRVVSV